MATIGENVIVFKGKTFMSPQFAAHEYRVHHQTVYYWVRENQVDILDLAKACEGTPFRPEHFKCEKYIEVESLKRRIEETRN
jgi:hypothetical protein